VPKNSRELALHTLLEWEHGDLFAHDIIDRLAVDNRLEHRDAALLQTLVFGVLRNINLLDCWLDELCSNKHLENEVHWLLRLGLAQLLILDMPAHAAVNETVSLAGQARGLVNAVLRRAEREKADLLEWQARMPLPDRFSHPDWLVERWTQQFGKVNATRLCEWNQTIAPTFIRVNRLHPDPLLSADLEGFSQVGTTDFYQVSQPPRQWLAEGRCYVQDPSTAVACELIAPKPGETILDACAAPGGKSGYLAQLMGNRGTLISCDGNSTRVRRMHENLQRLHASVAECHQHDWTSDREVPWGRNLKFDRILLDVPCSNTGVMRRRVDVRWRLQPWVFKEMTTLQSAIVKGVLPLLKSGGTLVYSTCSLDQEENEQLVAKLIKDHPQLHLATARTSLPWQDSTDGAYAARLVSQ